MIQTRTNTKTRTNERRSPPSTDARARAKRQRERERERERDDFDCSVEGGWIPMLYHAQKTNSLSLSLFSLPRFSCVTLSGASSHFALVASHSVSLPNIVGVVFCTRIRIRSSSGTMKLTKGFISHKKEGKRRESRKSSSSSSSFLVCSFWEEEGRKALTKKTKKKKDESERGERGESNEIYFERVRGAKVQIKNCFLASISLSLCLSLSSSSLSLSL